MTEAVRTKKCVEVSTGNIPYCEEFNEEELNRLFNDLKYELEVAKEKGFTSVYVTFDSTLEPYEDSYPGDPKWTVFGDRLLSPSELKAEEKNQKIRDYATKEGLTFFEASTILGVLARKGSIGVQ